MSGSTIGSLAGAGIGAIIGGPGGARVGWMIGGMLGGIVKPDQIKGPRLSDGQTVTSQEGIPIPFGFGTFPTGANCIWADVLVEHKHKEGGKGGPVTTNYTYTRSYAIGICEGEITAIAKVWRNGKLVYDITPTSTILGQNSKFLDGHKFYTGSETQLVDPTIEAVVGVGNSPPMRGLAYMVAENEDLTESAGAIAQWRFVVQKCGTVSPLPGSDQPTLIIGSSHYIGEPDDLSVGPTTVPALVSVKAASSIDGQVIAGRSSTNELKIWRWDGSAYQLMTLTGTLPGISSDSFKRCAISNDGQWVIVPASAIGKILVYQFDGVGYTCVTEEVYGLAPTGVCLSPDGSKVAASASDGVHTYNFDTSTGALTILHAAVAGTGDELDWVGNCILQTITSGGTGGRIRDAASLTILATTSDTNIGSGYWSADGSHLYWQKTGIIRIASWDGASLVNVGSVSPTYGSGGLVISKGRDYLLDLGGGSNPATLYSVAGATLTDITPVSPTLSQAQIGLFTGAGPLDSWYVVPDSPGSYVDADGNLITRYVTGEQVSACTAYLDDIVADLCERAGIDPSEYDVTDLAAIEVKGYGCATESSAQGFIEPLTQAFFFDRGEWDKKVRFILRGGASVASLDPDDLVAMDGPAIVQTRVQEVELLRKVNVLTVDPEAEFNVTKQSWERRIGTIQAKGEASVEIPIVTDHDTAAQIAEKRGKVAWAETDKFAYGLTLAHSALTPTDVVTLTDKAGVAHRQRLQAENEQAGVITIEEAMKDRASTYSSAATGVQNPNLPGGNDGPLVGPTLFAAMALPMLRSQDNSPGLYVGACGLLDGWPGCQILMSVDGGVSYSAVLTITVPTIMGELTAGCGTSGEPLQVRVFGGTLESKTTAQVDLGANWSAIDTANVAEIVAYETATPTGDVTYDLTDVTRGLDETTAAVHYALDHFMDLSTAYFLPISQDLAGETLYFKAVGLGVSADAIDPVAVPWAGVEYVEDGGLAS